MQGQKFSEDHVEGEILQRIIGHTKTSNNRNGQPSENPGTFKYSLLPEIMRTVLHISLIWKEIIFALLPKINMVDELPRVYEYDQRSPKLFQLQGKCGTPA